MCAISARTAEQLEMKTAGVAVLGPDGQVWTGTFKDADHADAVRECWKEAAAMEGEPIEALLKKGCRVVPVAMVAIVAAEVEA